MPRRLLAAAALTAAATLTLAGCVRSTTAAEPPSSSGATNLTVFISGDTNVQDLWEKGIIPAYKAVHPEVDVKTTIDLHGEHDRQTVAKLVTATKAGNDPGFDLVDAGFVVAGAAEAAPARRRPGEDHRADRRPRGDGHGGQGLRHPVPRVVGAAGVRHHQDRHATEDTRRAAHLDQENPGKFAYNSPSTGGSGGAFVTTVLDKYFLSAADQQAMRRATTRSSRRSWEPGIRQAQGRSASRSIRAASIRTATTRCCELLGSGEIQMAPVWSDQFITAQKTGTIPETVKYTQIGDPSFTGSAAYLGIPKTERRRAGARSSWSTSCSAWTARRSSPSRSPAIR